MTIRDYICDKLRAFGISEAQLVDMTLSTGLDLREEVSDAEPREVASLMINALEEVILSPKMTNISEGGFSVSWDFSNVGKYYLWLCRKWGVKPDDSTIESLGLSTITDRTDIW